MSASLTSNPQLGASRPRRHALLNIVNHPVTLAWALVGFLIAADDNRWVAAGGASAIIGWDLLRRGRILSRPITSHAPLLCMAVISLLATLPDPGSVFSIFKGLFYFFRPVLFTYAGYIIASRVKSDFILLATLMLVGVFDAFLYVQAYLTNPQIAYASREDIRNDVGVGNLSMWLAACVAFILWPRTRGPSKLFLMLAATIAITATYLSTSRSAYLAVFAIVVMLLASKRMLKAAPTAIALVLILFVAVFTPVLAWPNGVNVLFDLSAYVPELMPPYMRGLAGINEQWRGFEAWRAFDEVTNRVEGAFWLGLGLGKEVPLGMIQTLGGVPVRSIEVFHSAFSFAFVRAGVFGLILYVVWVRRCAKYLVNGIVAQAQKSDETMIRLGLAGIAMLAASSPTIGGLFNPGTAGQLAMLLFGIALQRIARNNGSATSEQASLSST